MAENDGEGVQVYNHYPKESEVALSLTFRQYEPQYTLLEIKMAIS